MDIVIGADHGGYDLKCVIVDYLKSLNHNVIDAGTKSKEACDYPDFAFKVAEYVSANPKAVGIMIDGAGIGSSMCANRVPGVLAAVCNELYVTRNAREHNGANVMCMGSMVVGTGLAKKLVDTFIEAKFEGGRHSKRVDKILNYSTFSPVAGGGLDEGLVKTIITRVLSAIGYGGNAGNHAVNPSHSGLISEEYIKKCQGGTELVIAKGTIVTDLAKDAARAKGITVRFE